MAVGSRGRDDPTRQTLFLGGKKGNRKRGNEKRLRFGAFILSLKLIGLARLALYTAQQFVGADSRKFPHPIAALRVNNASRWCDLAKREPARAQPDRQWDAAAGLLANGEIPTDIQCCIKAAAIQTSCEH